jgi:hypothetical protein
MKHFILTLIFYKFLISSCCYKNSHSKKKKKGTAEKTGGLHIAEHKNKIKRIKQNQCRHRNNNRSSTFPAVK